MTQEFLDIYEIIQEKDIKDLDSKGYLMRHKQSGARVLILSNTDDNKVFSIGFRTPPADDTGVPHILEHSVLCGSEKYTAKDPFVELCKGSLNTFLNAMTYPDKTVYPVASCNIVDFKNIMDVYLDAVFHPNIARNEKIFMQEGWHYEILEENGPLTINGVVYNEMKGAYSSAEGYLERMIMASLYPDTCYGRESGGDPDAIPQLTYENFLEFYNQYYHPCNSYIYMYGDMDIEERLLYIHEEYLSKYNKIELDSTIKEQKAFDSMVVLNKDYPITESEANGANDYLSYNLVVGKSTDKELYVAMDILDYVLLSTPGAPVKQALIDANIGEEVYSSYEGGILQPMYSIIAKNTSSDNSEEFLRIIKEILQKVVSEGIDKQALKAAINYYEFKYREADYGRYPKGLMYGLQAFDSWLYDENEPFMHIAANDTFAYLKKMIETDYFEKLIEKYLINNTHASLVILNAKPNLTAVKDKELEQKLADIRAGLDEEAIKKIYNDTKALKEYQDEPSTEEQLLTIPMLKREDIKREAMELVNEEASVAGCRVVYHNIFTNGIGYLKLYFNAGAVADDELGYMALLNSVLGYVDTESYSFRELSNEIDINTGAIATSCAIVQNVKNREKLDIMMEVKSKVLYENLPKALELIREILYTSKFDDYKRLKEIITELKSRLSARFLQASHSIARSVASTAFSAKEYYGSILSNGYDFYKFVEKLETEFEQNKEVIAKKLKGVVDKLFNRDNLIVSYTSCESGRKAFEEAFSEFAKNIREEKYPEATRFFEKQSMSLALTTSSQVNYDCIAGNYLDAGYEYKGTLKMLSTILGYDYLWTNVRVKGGAYGCMSGFGRNGDAFMVSYRDPKIKETLKIFEGVYQYLSNFNVSDRDMTKFVIGTMGSIDTPLNPSAKGARSFGAYITGITYEEIQKERDEILNVTTADIRELGEYVKAILENRAVCVIGNEDKIKANAEIFSEIRPMFTSAGAQMKG